MSYLTVREVAAQLRVSDLTIRRWIWSGKLPAIRVGRALRIRPADVEKLMHGVPQEPQPGMRLPRPGSPAAVREAATRSPNEVRPADTEELERLIAAACERPGEWGPTVV